jgi:hypothetical protein
MHEENEIREADESVAVRVETVEEVQQLPALHLEAAPLHELVERYFVHQTPPFDVKEAEGKLVVQDGEGLARRKQALDCPNEALPQIFV